MCPILCDHMDFFRKSMEFSRPEYWSGQPFPSPGDLANPGIEPRSPSLQADSLLAEPQGKPKNTGVGSLSLLQQIFPTQESTRGLLHCRRILDQLSSQGSPLHMVMYMFQCYCLSWSHPLLPRCAHKSFLYVCNTRVFLLVLFSWER